MLEHVAAQLMENQEKNLDEIVAKPRKLEVDIRAKRIVLNSPLPPQQFAPLHPMLCSSFEVLSPAEPTKLQGIT
jgi:hypothetical protein